MPKHTNPERERPAMASHRLDLPSRCDICGKARSTRKHQACSRIRQKHKSAEWAAYMAAPISPTRVNPRLTRKGDV